MSKALVLGGGGIAGISWEVGMICGLLREGIDLTDADSVIGTSAGSVVGALLTSGADLEEAIAHQAEAEIELTTMPDLDEVLRAFGVLADPTLDPREARRRVGEMALNAATVVDARIERIFDRLGITDWPGRPLKVTAVDARTGEFVIWDNDSGVPMPIAVASSCAVPCVFRPVAINDGHYIDGGIRSPTSADLAAGAVAVAVLEPMANLTPRDGLRTEIAKLGDARVAAVGPDEASVTTFGANILDPALWGPAFKAGLAQAASAAPALYEVWYG